MPLRAAMPRTTTLALAPMAVALPPRSAPSASAHHSALRLPAPPPAWTRSCDERGHGGDVGDVVDDAGQHAGGAEQRRWPRAGTGRRRRRRAASRAGSMTPVSTRRADHDEQPGEEHQRRPLDLREVLRGLEPWRRRPAAPAPSSATTRRLVVRAPGAATKPAMTSAEDDERLDAAGARSRMASRSSRAMTAATRVGVVARSDARNISRHSPTNTAISTTTIGARLTRKSLKVRPPRLAMMMFGGSPTSVAVPPMLDAITSAIRNGTGVQRRAGRRPAGSPARPAARW